MAGGGGDWQEGEGAAPEQKLKRARSPDDDGDNMRMVGCFRSSLHSLLTQSFRACVLGSTRRTKTTLSACRRSRVDILILCCPNICALCVLAERKTSISDAAEYPRRVDFSK